jgi:hypothetical protein
MSKLNGFVKKKRCPWNGEAICPLHNKGDPFDCKNDWGISTVHSTCKVTSNILCARLVPCVETELEGHQTAFPGGNMTPDQIVSLRKTLEKIH